jgi:hypothetical protein
MGQDDWLLMHRVADGDEGAVAECSGRLRIATTPGGRSS